MSRSTALLALAIVTIAAPADAARRRFGWLWDTDVVPERVVELEWWATERTGDTDGEAVLTVATVFGLTDTIEIAVPVDVAWHPSTKQTQFQDYGLEVRWRLATADPAKVGPVVPLIRLAAVRLLQIDAARLDADAVVSFDFGSSLHAVIDVDGYAITSGPSYYLSGGAGLSYSITDDLHAGVELYAVKTVSSQRPDESWLTVGPNLAYTHGRFWITASLPIGVAGDAPNLLPRVIWATAF